MSVSTYNLNCGYRKLNLKSVYLIPESHLKRIHIDNGEAYIDGLNTAPYFIDADEVTLNEETSLDERYRFSKTLTFRVRGRKELDFLHERYYAIVRTEEKVNYCVNVEFPSTVSYVYNLSQDRDETTFTLRTESNHPTLRLATVISDVNVCKGYFMACVKKLKLLEKNKAALREGYTVTSSEPFKNVDFLRPSITFSEEYNGSNVSTTLTFDIPLGLYKSSWHYNLLEFIENTYAMILEGCNGYNYAGFHFGLEPSFVITGDADNGMISMTLREMSESGGYYSQEPIPENINTATTYQYTDEHDGFVCVSAGMGQYTLQKEVNFLGNPTGNYRALQGYEDLFPDLNIVGTFTDVMLFPTDKCGGEGGGDMTGGTLPDVIELQSGQCKSFTFSAVCDWHVSDSTEDISITPTSGVANTLYNITVCRDAGGGGGGGTCYPIVIWEIGAIPTMYMSYFEDENGRGYSGQTTFPVRANECAQNTAGHGYGQSECECGTVYDTILYGMTQFTVEHKLYIKDDCDLDACDAYLNGNYHVKFVADGIDEADIPMSKVENPGGGTTD